MGGFTITPIDASLVGLVVIIVEALKRRIKIRDRWVPLLPIAMSFGLAAPAVIYTSGTVPPWPVFVSGTFLEGLKVAALSMSAFKVTKTTILGQ